MVRDPLPDAARTRVDPTSIDGEKSAEDSAQAGNSFGSPDAEACIVFRRLVRLDRAGPDLERGSVARGRAMHQSPLRHVIILNGLVLHRTVVPHQLVSGTPLVAINELWLDYVIRKGGDQGLCIWRLHPLDPDAPALAEYVEFDLPKAAGEGNLLGWGDLLVAEQGNSVIVVGVLDRGERGTDLLRCTPNPIEARLPSISQEH
jgi:hypothetical protein